ncbi:MAG: sel1 repeat family protein, partial [Roseiarcus sp.]
MDRRTTIFLLGWAFALSHSCAASAGPYEDGEVAYRSGDYAAALSLWRPLADRGDAVAQNALGQMYL